MPCPHDTVDTVTLIEELMGRALRFKWLSVTLDAASAHFQR